MRRFHLIIPILLYQYLEPIAQDNNLFVGQLIALFVELSINQIDLLVQEYGRQEYSIYESVSEDGNTIDVAFQLRRETYERAKWLHGYHNFYSMAQVVRRCIFIMLILLQYYGSFSGALAALNRLESATVAQRNSRDNHGIMTNFIGLIHLFADTRASYVVIIEYVVYMLVYRYPPPLIEE